jgi:hypothetical protein
MRVAPLLAVFALLAGVQSAGAATWKQVTAPGGSNIDQVSLVRTADGVLHVGWRAQTSPTTDALYHTAISAAGQIGATSPIATGWAVIENPALVYDVNKVVALFGGIRTTAPNEPNQDLNVAFSPDFGASWQVQTGSVVPVGAQAYGSPVSATVLPNGTLLEAWSGTLGTWAHAGLSQSSPNYDYQAPLGHYGYDANIASDATGSAMLAWYSNATGHLGVFAQGVNPANGAPVGSAINMPGTSNMHVGMIGRTPIVARPGGGFFVAYATGYPSMNRIMLWTVGGGTSLVSKVARAGSPTVTIAADQKGRLWIAWTAMVNGSPHVFARRTNRTATNYGAVVDAGRPRGAGSIYRLDASATAGALDLFANTSIGVSSTTSTFYSRVLPGLTLLASPAKLHRGKTTEVTFTVRDAGAPVKGARVKAQGKSGLTNAKGKVTLALKGVRRSVRARATASGYVADDVHLRVLRK